MYFVRSGPVDGANKFKNKYIMRHEQSDREGSCEETEKGEEWQAVDKCWSKTENGLKFHKWNAYKSKTS